MSIEHYYSLTHSLSCVYLSSAAGVPGTGVGSRRPAFLTPNLHSVLLCGSVRSRFQDLRSLLTHSDQVFLGLPRPLTHGTDKLKVSLMHEVARVTCPNHLKRLVRTASVTSCIPSLSSSDSIGISSSGLTPQNQRIMALSFRRSRCRSGAAGAQVSLPCRRADRIQVLKIFPRVLRVTCLEVRSGRSFLNFPQAVQHLVMIANSQPPPAHSMSPR